MITAALTYAEQGMDIRLLITIIVAIISSSALTVLITGLMGKKKTSAEVAKIKAESENTIAETYDKLIDRLIKEIDRLASDVDLLKKKEVQYLESINQLIKERDDFQGRVQILEAQNREIIQDNVRLQLRLEELTKRIDK